LSAKSQAENKFRLVRLFREENSTGATGIKGNARYFGGITPRPRQELQPRTHFLIHRNCNAAFPATAWQFYRLSPVQIYTHVGANSPP
jgi:hypothetical protein